MQQTTHRVDLHEPVHYDEELSGFVCCCHVNSPLHHTVTGYFCLPCEWGADASLSFSHALMLSHWSLGALSTRDRLFSVSGPSECTTKFKKNTRVSLCTSPCGHMVRKWIFRYVEKCTKDSGSSMFAADAFRAIIWEIQTI